MSNKPWGGRFAEATAKAVEAFTESISFDARLGPCDIQLSIAHAEMLGEVGLLAPGESRAITEALTTIGTELAEGRLALRPELEDIHMHIETALTERLGETGKKLHTARSRNDQVATALRLWTRAAIDRTDGLLSALQWEFLRAAEREQGVVMPGYTHLQRAQPILAAHYFLAHVERLERDRERLADARRRVNVLPLGCAALAGTSLPIDRRLVAQKLGFDAVARNSLDATSDRDFVAEAVFALCLIGEHLSGWAEEWILWNTVEFGFLELPDRLCTGSSIMPQKKNPDVLELIRGRTGRVVGSLSQLLILLKGLPLAYNRDLQEDKPPLFAAFDSIEASLTLAAMVVAGARLNRPRIAARLGEGFLDATTLMETLIRHGVAMRDAHEIVGRLVRAAEERRTSLAGLPADLVQAAHPSLTPEVTARVFGAEQAVQAFTSEGSTGPQAVAHEMAQWRTRLEARAPITNDH